MDDMHKYVFLLRVEEPALDTSSSLEMSRTMALLSALSCVAGGDSACCLLSCPSPGWREGGCRGHFVIIEFGGFI